MRQIYFGADGSITLGSFGPDEVSLVRRAVEAGIPLLAGAVSRTSRWPTR